MDSNKSVNNKRDFDVISLQNQDDDNVSSLSKVDGSSAKRLKGELDPIQMESILEKIFSNLDVDSLKNARQVNPRWSIEGAKMLITKCYLKIPSNLQVSVLSKNNKEMMQFKKFLWYKSSDRSMIPHIIIDKVGDVKLWKRLAVLGQQVKSLKLNMRCNVTTEVLQNLLDLLPNIKYVNFTNQKYFYWTESGFDIIKALTSVMSASEKDQSSLVISKINLVAENIQQLENIEKFADCNNILIEALTCDINPCDFHRVPNLGVRISNLMAKLLSTSRNILKSLNLSNGTPFLPLLDFPIMPALIYFELDFDLKPQDPLHTIKFSPSFQFSKTVPSLLRFDLRLYNDDESQPQVLEHLFEQTGTASSVKILEYHYTLENADIDPLWLTFPNIEEYLTSGYIYSQKMFESLWTYGTNLRKLTIDILKINRNPADLADLDAFVTGFTRETVDKVKGTPNLAPHPLEEMEQLRVNPSILNLKRLEHLEIIFWHLDQPDIPERFLATAGEYVFKLMPKESKIFLIFHGGNLGRYGPRSPLLDEVSKLANVTIKFGQPI